MLIEKTSAEMAGTFFDAARSSGLKVIHLQGKTINLMRYRRTRDFAKAHLEKFIPAALKSLIDIMSMPHTPPDQKQLIYDAIMERTNDEQVQDMGKAAGLPEFEKTILYKPDNEKPRPIIINTEIIGE